MTLFTEAIAALFADPHLGEDGLWKAGGTGPGVPVRLVRRAPDRIERFGESRAVLPTLLIDLRRAEVPGVAAGDVVEIGAEAFEVLADPVLDASGLVITCEAGPVH